MKVILLLFILLFPVVNVAGQSDVFENHTWFIDSAQLTTQSHDLFQGYDHSLTYTTPDGMKSSTDMCSISGANTLHCITGDTVVVDSEHYSATLNNKITYFEKDHQPTASPLSGHWHSDDAKSCETDIIIPYASYSATRFYPASVHGLNGSRSMLTYYISYDTYSHALYFGETPERSYYSYSLLDKNDKAIEGMQEIHKVAKFTYHNYYRDCIYVKI